MPYVFDTSSFIVLENYYPDTFSTFWDHLDDFVADGQLISVSEVYKELQNQLTADFLLDWLELHKSIFATPSSAEMAAVTDIFQVPHFQQLINEKQRVRGSPVADPWVVARGRVQGCCVVTEEVLKPNAAKIPNVCQYFDVDCTNLRGALSREGWRY